MNGLDEKIHAPTPRRREEARRRGQIARSADLSGAVVLVAGILALDVFGRGLFGAIAGQMRSSLGSLHEFSTSNVPAQLVSLAGAVALPLAPIVGAAVLAAVAAGLAQAGFLFTMEPLAPRAERLAPASGRLFSWSGAAIGLLKAAAVLAVLGWTLWSERAAFWKGADPMATIAGLAWTLSLRAALVLVVLGLIDYGVRRWQHERSLRMTPQEMREEMRQYEGDPQIRDRRRAVQRRLAMERMTQRVPHAAVVMTDPEAAAVAIEYDPATMDAPRIAAKGAGAVARQILELAHGSGVPVVESPAAKALYRQGEVGGAVPPEHFRAVADAVAFAMEARKQTVAL